MSAACSFALGGSPPRVGTMLRDASYKFRDAVHPTCVGTIALPAQAGTRRFTPTCVGTVARPTEMRMGVAVHPHVRGDNFCHINSRPINGFHPHVRGDNGVLIFHAPACRFTPTCVGTVELCNPTTTPCRFTPRAWTIVNHRARY